MNQSIWRNRPGIRSTVFFISCRSGPSTSQRHWAGSDCSGETEALAIIKTRRAEDCTIDAVKWEPGSSPRLMNAPDWQALLPTFRRLWLASSLGRAPPPSAAVPQTWIGTGPGHQPQQSTGGAAPGVAEGIRHDQTDVVGVQNWSSVGWAWPGWMGHSQPGANSTGRHHGQNETLAGTDPASSQPAIQAKPAACTMRPPFSVPISPSMCLLPGGCRGPHACPLSRAWRFAGALLLFETPWTMSSTGLQGPPGLAEAQAHWAIVRRYCRNSHAVPLCWRYLGMHPKDTCRCITAIASPWDSSLTALQTGLYRLRLWDQSLPWPHHWKKLQKANP